MFIKLKLWHAGGEFSIRCEDIRSVGRHPVGIAVVTIDGRPPFELEENYDDFMGRLAQYKGLIR